MNPLVVVVVKALDSATSRLSQVSIERQEKIGQKLAGVHSPDISFLTTTM